MTFNQWVELILFIILFITFMVMLVSEIRTNRSMKKWFDRLEKEHSDE